MSVASLDGGLVHVLLQPPGTAITEVMVIPTGESSWP
jgi:hypothetical protein